jgi:hypothetical protein
MFKRFHDTEKWDKPWYRRLLPAEKCAFDFITSKCDNVGVWIPDFESAEFYIGQSIDWDSFKDKVNGNICVMDNGKWWLVDFCRFQYPELEESTNSKPLLSYIALLKKHTLWIPYCNGIHTVQDKDKDKEKDKDKDKDKESKPIKEKPKLQAYGIYENVLLSDSEYLKLADQIPQLNDLIEKMSTWCKANGKTFKDYAAALRNWAKREPVDKPKKHDYDIINF